MAKELFNQIVIVWILLGVIVFIVNLKIIAPYGRHASKKWGLLIDSRLAWIVMEAPVLILVMYFVLTSMSSLSPVVWLLFFLFTAHYFHRTFIFPFKLKGKNKKMPLGVMLLAIVFNMFNGYFIGYYLGNLAQYDTAWFFGLPFIGGAILFGIGVFINWRADSILISLRTGGFSGYKIPFGFLFKWVSCPNHLGEMIEWLGFALMSFSLPTLAFAVWTIANLIPRSLAHHKWYLANFSDYPKNRKAVIPGVL